MKKYRQTIDEEIDLVLPWVDGNDPKWKEDKAKYDNRNLASLDEERYRELGLLKFVFRGIEQNLPWIRKIHIITYGHLPKWLNTNCEKLNIVNHKDFIVSNQSPQEINISFIAMKSKRG